MQYFLDHCERNIKLDSTGDIVMTARDKEQNVVGDCIVILGDDMFDDDFGIDYKTLYTLGNDTFAKDFLKSEIHGKFNKQNLDVERILIESFTYPVYEAIVTFWLDDALEQIEINSII